MYLSRKQVYITNMPISFTNTSLKTTNFPASTGIPPLFLDRKLWLLYNESTNPLQEVEILTLKELLYTVTIYDERSFSAAAKKLYVSQSALSQSIRKLEESLGSDLFIRQGVKTEPTRMCRTIVQQGRKLLDQWEAFEEQIHILSLSQRSELTVGMPPFLMKNLAPYVLPIFEEAHPNVRVELIEASSNALEQLVMDGIINLCVVQEPLYLEGLQRLPVITPELLLAVPAAHPFCRQNPYQNLQNLKHVPLARMKGELFSLLKNPRISRVLEQLFEENGFEPQIYRNSTVWSNVKDYVKQGSCVAPIHEFVVNHEPDEDSICYYRMDPPSFMPPVVATFCPGKRLTPPERWFIDALEQYQTLSQRQANSL